MTTTTAIVPVEKTGNRRPVGGGNTGKKTLSLFDVDPSTVATLTLLQSEGKKSTTKDAGESDPTVMTTTTTMFEGERTATEPSNVVSIETRVDKIDEMEMKIALELEEKPKKLFCASCLASFEDRESQVDMPKDIQCVLCFALP